MSLFDIRVCWNCRNLWVEDDHQQDDVDVCPTCGAHASARPDFMSAGLEQYDGDGTDITFGDQDLTFRITDIEF